MSLKSAPFWWVICDDCGVSAQESSDVSAWMQQDVAIDEAVDQGWWIADRNDDDCGKDYCDDCVSKHGIWYCEGCAELKRIVRDDGARWCAECAASPDLLEPKPAPKPPTAGGHVHRMSS